MSPFTKFYPFENKKFTSTFDNNSFSDSWNFSDGIFAG